MSGIVVNMSDNNLEIKYPLLRLSLRMKSFLFLLDSEEHFWGLEKQFCQCGSLVAIGFTKRGNHILAEGK